jgi:hypothetical protein
MGIILCISGGRQRDSLANRGLKHGKMIKNIQECTCLHDIQKSLKNAAAHRYCEQKTFAFWQVCRESIGVTQNFDPSAVAASAAGDDGAKFDVDVDTTPWPPLDLCIRIMTVRALRWTSESRGQACRQCSSISTQPGVLARTLTKAGVMERLRRTRHPRLSMDLFAWKFFMARMVRRAIW